MGALLIAWTARGAMACWVATFLQGERRSGRMPRRAEVLWSAAGWLLLAAHVLCAFHFQHHWSHAEAYAHTARRTAETVGWNWGGGLYVNYAAIALWGADVLVGLRACRQQHPVPRWW
ncbi:MAG: hypothetical protein JNG89_02645, partial [Planctomycetaceae bacterium]|nr:hypothetical protein [Planctomycetaceae bacterium]